MLAYFNVILGAAVEFKSSDLSIETVLSEEGHQVGTEGLKTQCLRLITQIPLDLLSNTAGSSRKHENGRETQKKN